MDEGDGPEGSEGSTRVVELRDDNFDSLVRGSKYAAVIFWSGSCMPCRMMLFIFDELSQLHQDVFFGKVNVGTSSVAASMGVMSVPTVLLFRDGKRVARIVGVKPLKVLEDAISNHLSDAPKRDVYSEGEEV